MPLRPLSWGFLILPLLGGFLLVSTWNRTRFLVGRSSGYRLFFYSSVAGAVLLLLGYLSARCLSNWTALASAWREVFSFRYSGSSIGAFVYGAIGGYVLNFSTYLLRIGWYDKLEYDSPPFAAWTSWLNDLRYRRDRDQRGLTAEVERLINADGNSFEQLLVKALVQRKQVFVTLETGKVYIGYVVASFNPARDRKYVSIQKVVSGYRHAETQSFIPVTIYDTVSDHVIDTIDHIEEDDFQVVLPVSMISSISIFDIEVYEYFIDQELAIQSDGDTEVDEEDTNAD